MVRGSDTISKSTRRRKRREKSEDEVSGDRATAASAAAADVARQEALKVRAAEDLRRAAEDARRQEEDRSWAEAVGGGGKAARKAVGGSGGAGVSGVVDSGRMERVRRLKEVEGEMQRLGLEKKRLREAVERLSGLGGGLLGAEVKQLQQALSLKEAAFNDAVSRHRGLRKGEVSFLPAASSTMAAPSGRPVGGGGGGAARGVSSSPVVGRGGNRGARGGRRGSWAPAAGNWTSLPHPSQSPIAHSSPQPVPAPAVSAVPPPPSPGPSLSLPPPVQAPVAAPPSGLNQELLSEFAEFLAQRQQR